MKIRDRYTGGIRHSDGVRERGRVQTTAEAPRSGNPLIHLHISGRSVEIQKARSFAFQAPDIRQELVDEICGLIAEGQYGVRGRDVVPKMIREHLVGFED